MRVDAEENSAVELTCPSDSVYRIKAWYRGFYNQNNTLSGSIVSIYSLIGATGNLTTDGATRELSLNRVTFTLTISPVMISYNGSDFTCKVLRVDLKIAYFQRQLFVYIQPRIEMTGLDGTIRENNTVMVNCVISRIFPRLQEKAFKLTWEGDSPIYATESVVSVASNQLFSYSVKRQKTITRADQGKVVTCAVDPTLGTRAETKRIVSVLYMTAETKPTISIDNPYPYLNDDVTFTCNADSVDANPRAFTVTWFKNEELLSRWTMSGLTHGLMASPEDSGNYSCSVRNGAGSSLISALMEINVNNVVDPHIEEARQKIRLAAGIGGGIFAALILIILLIVILIRNKKKNTKNGGSMAGLTEQGPDQSELDTVGNGLDNNGLGVEKSVKDNVVYAQINKSHRKTPRANDTTNDNAKNVVVYAELNLENNPGRRILPPNEKPTEYASISTSTGWTKTRHEVY